MKSINKLAAELHVATFHLRGTTYRWQPYLEAMLEFQDCRDVSKQLWSQGNRGGIVKSFLELYPPELKRLSAKAIVELNKHLKELHK